MKTKKMLLITLTCVLLIGIVPVPAYAAASTYKQYNTYTSKGTKIGAYRIRWHYKTGLYSIKGKKKVKIAGKNSNTVILSNKKKIYYSVTKGNHYYIYSANINGSKKKKIVKGKLKKDAPYINLEYGYGNKIYFVTELDPGTLKVVNIKTKKTKKLAANVTSTTRSGNYLYLDPYSGDAYGGQPLRVLTVNNDKVKTISKCANYTVRGKTLYYSNYKKTLKKGFLVDVLQCKRDGSKKKYLAKNIKIICSWNISSKGMHYLDQNYKEKYYKFK
ncbi:DUF5050 domain-containing protein [Anaerostipes sp.]|uniref:DUF5050 domain-containing protein n=1 Tax=Anaerostipes sp. TaxID=1872530 RepID=UPI0025BFF8ED|nr:DUF5050 domain-containing protein [Anaerostipes sp.]MBS7008880.1 DUF5050 domain-containing protein [Anaerostipes sp.]